MVVDYTRRGSDRIVFLNYYLNYFMLKSKLKKMTIGQLSSVGNLSQNLDFSNNTHQNGIVSGPSLAATQQQMSNLTLLNEKERSGMSFSFFLSLK